MNKILIYIIIGLIALFGLYYFLGELGLVSGLVAGLGIGGSQLKVNIKKQENELLEDRKKEKEAQLKEIEEKQKELKLDDLTPEQEREYWKKQQN